MYSPSPVFQEDKLSVASNRLRALAHPLRLEIINFISRHGMVTVQSIYETLNIEQSLTSQHLRILRRADLVSTQRDGKFVNYKVNNEQLNKVRNAVSNFVLEDSVLA